MSAHLDLERIYAALAQRPSEGIEGPDVERRAAVATILRPRGAELEVLLIRRAERHGDPWSGHMAFPGGGHEAHDPDLVATAIRETHEEVGLALATSATLVGPLDDVRAVGRGVSTGLVVRPFLFVLEDERGLRTSAEAAEVHWTPLAPMFRGERDATIDYPWQGTTLQFPGFRLPPPAEDRIVWGLTHRMLTMLFARVRETA